VSAEPGATPGRSGPLRSLFALFAPPPPKPEIEDRAEVDRLYRRYRLQMILALTFGYGISYTCRNGLSLVKTPLIDGGIFSAEELGWIEAATFITYALGRLCNGTLSDKVNLRVFIPTGLALSALLNLAMGSSTLFVLSLGIWVLNGWFQGFGGPASVVGVTRWFGPKERGTMYGVWSMAHSIGEGLTWVGTATLVTLTAWNAAFWGPGIFCLVMAGLLFFVLRDRPAAVGLPPILRWKREHVEPIAEPAQEQARLSMVQAQLQLLRNPAIWIIGLSASLMYVTRFGVNAWGVHYLEKARDMSLMEAGSLLGINTMAGTLGSVAYGYISDRFFAARRPPVTLLFGLAEIVGLLIIFFGPPGPTVVVPLGFTTMRLPVFLAGGFLLYGFSLSGILAVLGGLFAVDIADKRAAGAAMGLIGIFSYLGAGLASAVNGYLVGQGTTMVDGVSDVDFSQPIALWIGASVLSAALAATLWRVRAKE
jgi:OPA family sugar phosphate sensor protein UhpC-like MFS transporter